LLTNTSEDHVGFKRALGCCSKSFAPLPRFGRSPAPRQSRGICGGIARTRDHDTAHIIEKWSGASLANQTIDGLLADFEVHPPDKTNFRRARQLPMGDFEDAVIASVAEATASEYIVTRNAPDFAGSPVPAVTPTEFLEAIADLEAE
jgi:hypothetical protein